MPIAQGALRPAYNKFFKERIVRNIVGNEKYKNERSEINQYFREEFLLPNETVIADN